MDLRHPGPRASSMVTDSAVRKVQLHVPAPLHVEPQVPFL